jgi:hypothetical protein
MSAEGAKPVLTEAEVRSIEAFQVRRVEFQPHWNRNIVLLFLPGVALLVLGGGLIAGEHGKLAGGILFAGLALFFAGMVRGVALMTRYLRCPSCERIQKPGWQYPYRKCKQCGARLSMGVKDSR